MRDERVFIEIGSQILDEVIGDLWTKAFITVKSTRYKNLDLLFCALQVICHRHDIKNTGISPALHFFMVRNIVFVLGSF